MEERAEEAISRSVGRMDKKERFSVIGFGARGNPVPFSTTLVLAVPENARGVAQWMSNGKALLAAGTAKEPPASAALDLAVRQHAEAVYLLYGPDTDLEEVRGKLEDSPLLALAQMGQKDDPPVRKFQRIMMHLGDVLIDLSEDCGRLASCSTSQPQ